MKNAMLRKQLEAKNKDNDVFLAKLNSNDTNISGLENTNTDLVKTLEDFRSENLS
jgi:hypothetical protein